MLHVSPTVFCVGSSKLVREVTVVAGHDVRVRWAADLAAFRRSIGGLPAGSISACVVATGVEGRAALEFLKQSMPNVRRVIVADTADLNTAKDLLASGVATSLLKRPLDGVSLSAAIAHAATPKRTAPLNIPTTAATTAA